MNAARRDCDREVRFHFIVHRRLTVTAKKAVKKTAARAKAPAKKTAAKAPVKTSLKTKAKTKPAVKVARPAMARGRR